MTTYTEKDYTLAYERKRESSIKRNIEFELTLEEYTAIMKARHNLTCGYTGKPFNMKSSSHKDYPELDRIMENGPYSKSNIIFVRKCVHKLKTDYIPDISVIIKRSKTYEVEMTTRSIWDKRHGSLLRRNEYRLYLQS